MSPLPFAPATSGGASRPWRPRVVGLDLSLTSTGMSDGLTHHAVQTKPEDGCTEERFIQILAEVRRFVHGIRTSQDVANLVVIEGGAFSRGTQSAAAEQLSGLRYLIRYKLHTWGVPFAVVTPTCLKTYTTGYGKATKQMMVAAVFQRHGIDLSGVKVKDGRYDQADALALAAMGYEHLGHPLSTEGPPPPRKSLLAVDWPNLYTD